MIYLERYGHNWLESNHSKSPGWSNGKLETWLQIQMMMGSGLETIIKSLIYNTNHTKSQILNVSCLVLQLFLPNLLETGVNREWRCSWSNAGRWCSNYIIFIAYWGATYIRYLTASLFQPGFLHNVAVNQLYWWQMCVTLNCLVNTLMGYWVLSGSK